MQQSSTPKVIMHDSVSVDGSFVGFEMTPEFMGLHYELAGNFEPAVRLIGSNTAATSIEMFGGFEPETPEDFHKPQKPGTTAEWVIVDSKAVLKDKLHYFRRSEYCGDVAVLVAENTPEEYLRYLAEREYDHFVSGKRPVDLACGLEWIAERYQTENVLVDAGSGLTNALLNHGLIDEISLLVLPTVVGQKAKNLFEHVCFPVQLKPVRQHMYPGGYVWSLYEVVKES